MINPMISDAEIEDWFVRYGGDADGASDCTLMTITLWIPVISIPANDR